MDVCVDADFYVVGAYAAIFVSVNQKAFAAVLVVAAAAPSPAAGAR